MFLGFGCNLFSLACGLDFVGSFLFSWLAPGPPIRFDAALFFSMIVLTLLDYISSGSRRPC